MSKRNIMAEFLKTENKTALAKALGISRPTLDRYRREPGKMPAEVLIRAATLKGCEISTEWGGTTYTL